MSGQNCRYSASVVMKDGYILFLGTGILTGSNKLLSSPNMAAEFWQSQFLKALQEAGYKCRVVTHPIYSRWPKGPIYVRACSSGGDDTEALPIVGYVNPPFSYLKGMFLSFSYTLAVRNIIKTHGKPIIIISYNAYPHTFNIIKHCKRKYDTTSVMIIADYPARGVFRSKRLFETGILNSDGCVFFSQELFRCFESKIRAINFEGGIPDSLNFRPISISNRPRKKIVMYCGSDAPYSGLPNLIKAFEYINSSEVNLWVAGGWTPSDSERVSLERRGIYSLGYLDDERIRIKMSDAAIFINPYDLSFDFNKYNFPSKVLFYLPFLKPIVSTKARGIPERYSEVLTFCDDNSPEALSRKIIEVLGWSEDRLVVHQETLRTFVRRMSWRERIYDFTSWLETEGLIGRLQ